MTSTAKPVERQTFAQVRYKGKFREIILRLRETYLTVRLKGTRMAYTVTYYQLWERGAANEAEARRRERAEARKKKRGTV